MRNFAAYNGWAQPIKRETRENRVQSRCCKSSFYPLKLHLPDVSHCKHVVLKCVWEGA